MDMDYAILALIKWDLVDEEMCQKARKKQITKEKYNHYLRMREVVHIVMTKGDCCVSDDDLSALKRFSRQQ